MRKSLKMNRDEVAFVFFKEELEKLKEEAKQGSIDLCFFDETGLNLNPTVPYAWQVKGRTALLPAQRTKGVSILGILNPLKNKFVGNLYEGAANADCVIQTLDEYSKTLKNKTILILDNATIHKSKTVNAQAKTWRARGLYLQFIPAYCPELNLIEILWKMLKHYWLELEHYASMDILIKKTISILQRYGDDYSISFV